MLEIGKIQKLQVVTLVDFGVYLDGDDYGEILMPKRYVPENCAVDDFVEVFVYFDSDDRIIATTETPYAMVDDLAVLKVVSVNSVGAFLDWGLVKDLFVPFKEQRQKMREDSSYLVKIVFDEKSERIIASSKIDKYLDGIIPDFEIGDGVDIIIYAETELGYKAAINKCCSGIVYKNEIFQKLKIGQQLPAYILKVREDEKIDLSLQKPGLEKVDELSTKILELLKEKNGFIPVNGKSSTETVYKLFEVSKKTFKKSIGKLYKKRLITIDDDGIRLV